MLVRPAVICFNSLFDPNNPDKRGTLVTPHLTAMTADLTGAGTAANRSGAAALSAPQLASLVSGVQVAVACPGRYAHQHRVPDGQAWTVPNEAGACAAPRARPTTGTCSCTIQPRPVLRSQGTRAVVEIVTQAHDGEPDCAGPSARTPAECLSAALSRPSARDYVVPARDDRGLAIICASG